MFSKKHLVKKEYIPGQDESDGSEDEDEEGKGDSIPAPKRSKSKSKKDSSKTASYDNWYLVCDTKKD